MLIMLTGIVHIIILPKIVKFHTRFRIHIRPGQIFCYNFTLHVLADTFGNYVCGNSIDYNKICKCIYIRVPDSMIVYAGKTSI